MESAMKTAIVGCGKISDTYFKNIQQKFTNLKITACCAKHLENAKRKGAEYGVKACDYEEILNDPSIEMILILTPAPTHYELIQRAIESGKHVYTEKPVTMDLKKAKELAEMAKNKGVYLGAAPETFLSAAFQTAKKAIEDGMLGKITSFHICANRDYNVLASLFGFLRQPGGGICFDYSVYHLTALVQLLGRVDRVYAKVQNAKPVRKNVVSFTPDFGKEFDSPNESIAAAIIQLKSGVTGTLMMNGESNLMDLPDFRIYGEKGILVLPDANQFIGEAEFYPDISELTPDLSELKIKKTLLEPVSDINVESRGIGPAEMAQAIKEHRECKTNIETAIHVLEVIQKMILSSEKGTEEKIEG